MNKTDRNTDISVILPLFTNNNTVTNTINSILEQSFKNFELIIIDNTEITKTFEQRDSRIKYVLNKGEKTTVSSLKQGVLISQSQYIAIIDENSIAEKNRLQKQIDYLNKNKDIALIGTFLDTDNKEYKEKYNNPNICTKEEINFWINFYNPIYTGSIMFNNEIVSKQNVIYQNSLPYAYDYYFIQELISNNLKVEILPEKLTKIECTNKIEETETYKKLKNITNQEIQYGLLKRFFENNDEFFYVKNLFNGFPFGNYDKQKVYEGLNNIITKNKNIKLIDEETIKTVIKHPTLLH